MAMCMELIDQEPVPIAGSISDHNYLVKYPPDMGKVNRVTQHAIGCERTGKIIHYDLTATRISIRCALHQSVDLTFGGTGKKHLRREKKSSLPSDVGMTWYARQMPCGHHMPAIPPVMRIFFFLMTLRNNLKLCGAA